MLYLYKFSGQVCIFYLDCSTDFEFLDLNKAQTKLIYSQVTINWQ